MFWLGLRPRVAGFQLNVNLRALLPMSPGILKTTRYTLTESLEFHLLSQWEQQILHWNPRQRFRWIHAFPRGTRLSLDVCEFGKWRIGWQRVASSVFLSTAKPHIRLSLIGEWGRPRTSDAQAVLEHWSINLRNVGYFRFFHKVALKYFDKLVTNECGRW